jgi:tetratricopeptide (TPR) repeat protein
MKPVTLFKSEAEKYGYIVVGSNNSKNGTPWPTTNSFYNSVMVDVNERFSIDKNRIYTVGFSGGSRVASTIAIQNGGIAGVVGFSAGFPNLNQPISNKFDYLGVCGNADFNYNEMNELDKNLESIKFNHFLLVFNGKHEWPSQELIPDIFYWLEFCAYRNKLAIPNNSTIKAFIDKSEKEIGDFKLKDNQFGEYKVISKLTRFLDGVSEIDSYKTKFTELEKSTAVQNELKLIELDIAKEKTLQGNYMKAMNANDSKWWTNEVGRINNLIRQNKNERECLIYKRILSFLSIGAYSYSNNALKSGQLEKAQNFITIYLLVDPENSEAPYFQAELFAIKNENDKALQSLESAIKLGFNDINRIQTDSSFSRLSTTQAFSNLIEKMKIKK